MTGRGFAAGAVAMAVTLATTPVTGRTTVSRLGTGRAVVAYNHDVHPSEGLVRVNKRGTSKRRRVEPQVVVGLAG